MEGTETNSDTHDQSTSVVWLVVSAIAEEVWVTETSRFARLGWKQHMVSGLHAGLKISPRVSSLCQQHVYWRLSCASSCLVTRMTPMQKRGRTAFSKSFCVKWSFTHSDLFMWVRLVDWMFQFRCVPGEWKIWIRYNVTILSFDQASLLFHHLLAAAAAAATVKIYRQCTPTRGVANTTSNN